MPSATNDAVMVEAEKPAFHRFAPLVAVYSTLLGAGLRSWSLGSSSVWLDEALSLDQTDSLDHATSAGFHPPLYYVSGFLWRQLFGDDLVTLRAWSVLAGAALIPLSYLVAARVFRERGFAALVSLLVAILPALVWHSRDARMYPLWAAFTLAAVAAALSLDDDRRWRSGVVYIAATVLALLTHHYAAFFALSLACATFVLIGQHPWRKSRPEVLRWAALNGPLLAALPIGLLVVGLLADGDFESFFRQLPRFAFVRDENTVLTSAANLIWFENWAYRRVDAGVALKGALTLATLSVAGLALARSGIARGRRGLALFIAAAVPYLLVTCLPVRGYTRLLLPLAPLFVILLVGLLAVVVSRFGKRGALVATCGVLLFAASLAPHLGHVYTREIEPWNDVVALLRQEGADGDVIFVTPRYMRRPLHAAYDGPQKVYGLANDDDEPSFAELPSLTESAPAAWLVRARRGKGDPDHVVVRFLNARYRTLRHFDFGPELRVYWAKNPRAPAR